MIALVLALQLASSPSPGVDGSPFGTIPKQQLPETGCAVFLWSGGERRELVAMANTDPARLRLMIDGRPVDLARAEQQGAASFGFSGATHYRSGDADVLLDMAIVTDPNLTEGGTVPSATLTLTRSGQDVVVLPVAGLIGCAAPTPGR